MRNDFSGYPEPLKNYAAYKLTVQNCSDKTVSEYLLDLRTFSRYLTLVRSGTDVNVQTMKECDISGLDMDFYRAVTQDEIYSFITYAARDRGNSGASRSRKLSAIRGFFRYCTVKRNYMEINPCANIESPKKKKQLPKFLSLDESVELLSAAKNDTESKYWQRDYCILTLFLNCGMRLSELCGIDLSDIDREKTSLRVVGKGSKERVVYLNSACRSAIEAYMPLRLATPCAPGNENALFISRIGRRISVKTVQWMVKKYLGAAGLEYKHYSTHKLRHTAATLMYRSGEVDIRVLKDILGHEQLNTTQIYTHVSDEGMQEAMDHNPLTQVKIK